MTEPQLEILFGDLTVAKAILWITAAVALVFLLVKLWPALTKFVSTVNALSDLPTKLAKIDTIETKIDGIESQVQDIHHETHFNSGTSIKDATVRIEQKVDGLQKLMEDADAELAERVEDIETTLNPRRSSHD